MLPWADTSEEDLCNEEAYEIFAFYLANTYVIAAGNRNAGEHLDCTTGSTSLNGMLNQAHVKFGDSTTETTKVFFKFLEK